ncbi:hypothetical protein FHG87_023444 [Trinorchestia longiramus]|nr:hypothetical protein FHG87_023444 [Trinorchestia longiramus]
MTENNRDCKATSILCVMMKSLHKGPSLMISDTRSQADAEQLELHLLNNCIHNNWISEKGQKIGHDNETTVLFADVKELYESEKDSILRTTTLTQFAVNPSEKDQQKNAVFLQNLCQKGPVG